MSIEFRDQQLHVESIACEQLARQFGTPLYVYSRAAIEHQWQAIDSALSGIAHRVCYAVKANSNLAVLSVLVKLGSSFDVVSIGEIQRVLLAGGKAEDIVFSGVGKTSAEITAALKLGIACFNIESIAELERVNALAGQLQLRAPISIRVNPNVDAKTHPYISTGLRDNKFGVAWEDILSTYERASKMQNIKVVGIDCHIGSQLTEFQPYADALDKLLEVIAELKAMEIHLEHLDLGGGMGVRYEQESDFNLQDYAAYTVPKLKAAGLSFWVEPGRYIVANAGLLLCTVEYLKPSAAKNFAIVDASMSELIRPALYSAYQSIINTDASSTAPEQCYDIVGPVCESADFLGKDRLLRLHAGDLLAVESAGAYCFGMASNYNTRCRPAEILVDGDHAHLARRRETLDEVLSLEAPL